MNFTIRIVNPPAGTAWWYTIWWVSPTQWNSPWLPIATTQYTFSGVGVGPGVLYVMAYDVAYNILTDTASRGRITPAEGSVWEYDFATKILREVTAPPPGAAKASFVSLTAPVSARAGDPVSVSIVLKNVGGAAGWLAMATLLFTPTPVSAWVEPGAQASFSGTFTMPGSDQLVEVWAYHWDGSQWVLDENRVVTVRLEVAAAAEYRDLTSVFSLEASFA